MGLQSGVKMYYALSSHYYATRFARLEELKTARRWSQEQLQNLLVLASQRFRGTSKRPSTQRSRTGGSIHFRRK